MKSEQYHNHMALGKEINSDALLFYNQIHILISCEILHGPSCTWAGRELVSFPPPQVVPLALLDWAPGHGRNPWV